MQHSEARNPIEAARERLDGGRKWCKDYGTPEDPSASVCVVGALEATKPAGQLAVQLDALKMVHGVVAEQFRDRLTGLDLMSLEAVCIGRFNDHPDTTFADVDLVLDKAARRWDEQS